MPNAKPAEGLTCMSCGAPIKSGFFCPRCVSTEEPEKKKEEAWKGSRFTGDAKKKRQKEMLKEDLSTWAKRVLILLVIGGVGFGIYKFEGDRIEGWYNQVRGVTTPREKYDPTKDSQADVNDQGQENGSRAFTPQNK